MANEPRMTAQTLKVLGAFLASGNNELSGAEIGREAKLASGTLYPILIRLEDASWLESRWEDGDPQVMGRPRKRFYRITGLGESKARTAFNELSPVIGRLAWA